jgi:hypothetical protein
MTAHLAITDHQQLVDTVVISVGVLVILAVGLWLERRWDRIPVEVPEDLPVLDHAKCVAEGCIRVLCFCTTLHPRTGQPVTCAGADRPACHHSLVSRATTGGHCSTHQRDCDDCRAEDFSVWGFVR